MLITVSGRMVRSHGEGEVALPESGRIKLSPLAHGTWEGALRGRDSVVMRVTDGQAEAVDLTPGPWRVRVEPEHGPAWDSWQVELEPGMAEPVDLADLAPVVIIDGEKWAAGPPGASVTGGRDNGDGTVSFELSDGTFTDPVVLPPGPAGRGIVSISDPDADSRVTITFTDDSTATVQAIRGAKGDKGDKGDDSTVPGPAPTVSWDGDRLVVEGVAGPSLTGPDGPAPTVAWSGDRLTVGGVQGPSLTGPASTVPGPPGAVPTASDYLVVGPGRPDAPTTTGLSSAQIAALPVGCEYRSTDGASVGAWTWAKQPAGWVVTQGDTGWKDFTATVTGRSVGSFKVRRTPSAVLAAFDDLAFGSLASGQPTVSLPQGFHVAGVTYIGAVYAQQGGTVAGGSYARIDFIGGNIIRFSAATSTLWLRDILVLPPSTNPWPTTLS